MRYKHFLLVFIFLFANSSFCLSAEEDTEPAFALWSRVISKTYTEEELDTAHSRLEEEGKGTMKDIMALAHHDQGATDQRYRIADLILSKGEYLGYRFDPFGETPIAVVVNLLSTTNGDCAEEFFTSLGDKKKTLLSILKLDEKSADDDLDDEDWRRSKLLDLLSQ